MGRHEKKIDSVAHTYLVASAFCQANRYVLNLPYVKQVVTEKALEGTAHTRITWGLVLQEKEAIFLWETTDTVVILTYQEGGQMFTELSIHC